MATNVSWYFGEKVILSTFTGQVTLDEIKLNDSRVLEYLPQGKRPVHLFIDIRKLDVPLSLFQIKQAIEAFKHPSIGWGVLIGRQSPLVRSFTSLISQMSGIRLKMVDTLEEGVAFLARVDKELAEPREEWSDVNPHALVIYSKAESH